MTTERTNSLIEALSDIDRPVTYNELASRFLYMEATLKALVRGQSQIIAHLENRSIDEVHAKALEEIMGSLRDALTNPSSQGQTRKE
jgi:hypothetical protein